MTFKIDMLIQDIERMKIRIAEIKERRGIKDDQKS